ncbi:MAG: hypothetical protein CMG74_12220 [Candidatus Marinimicrobia bacterium]|nr:hypothetical protein [Candidatus Neomarinimicrobiota bacterium]|tara:strand:+ start:258 stop:449 length:192 start_codon:yes stop_codon:yes gene_type:complete
MRFYLISIFAGILFMPLFGSSPDLGKPAPNFLLPDQDGNLHALMDYRGQKLVLYFFPKANTPG